MKTENDQNAIDFLKWTAIEGWQQYDDIERWINTKESNKVVMINRLYELYSKRVIKEPIGLYRYKGIMIYEGDMFFEEVEDADGDTVLFSIVTWIDEWAMYTLLGIGEYIAYEDNGVSILKEDTAVHNSYILDSDEFTGLHYKGNIFENSELLEIGNYHT